MGTPATVAFVLGLGALPVGLWAAWSDLRRLRIPNPAVLALVAIYLVAGLALVLLGGWSLGEWAWRWTHLVVLLLAGLGLWTVGLIGAGDAKLAAAVAPFVALPDWRGFLGLLAVALLGTWVLHRLARHTVGPRLAPDWASWTSGKRFPMGVPLVATLLAYLAICATA